MFLDPFLIFPENWGENKSLNLERQTIKRGKNIMSSVEGLVQPGYSNVVQGRLVQPRSNVPDEYEAHRDPRRNTSDGWTGSDCRSRRGFSIQSQKKEKKDAVEMLQVVWELSVPTTGASFGDLMNTQLTSNETIWKKIFVKWKLRAETFRQYESFWGGYYVVTATGESSLTEEV